MVLWIVCTGMSLTYYGLDIYLLDHLRDSTALVANENLVMYGTAVAQIPGYVIAAYMVERLGRRTTLISFLFATCVGSLVEAYVTPTTAALFLAGCCRSFFFMGAWGALYAYVPEHYPITIRVMGSAYAWGISRIGAFVGPYLVIWMSEQWNFSIQAVVWSLSGVLLLVIIVLLLWGFETAGQQIDETARKSKTACVSEPESTYTILEERRQNSSLISII
uniref:Major facilitator superfamily (MFS) profile domain-containing protein n=1 Tax=Globisporangium ultimum (strain ATCC 200006 / CBS 805.95 / DAOM BR144) TaxID=431595 RepID=K3XD57_GLOUD